MAISHEPLTENNALAIRPEWYVPTWADDSLSQRLRHEARKRHHQSESARDADIEHRREEARRLNMFDPRQS